MIKSELIKRIATKVPNLTTSEVSDIVGIVFESMFNSLVQGDKVEIRGFCAMSTRKRKPRMSTNPRTKKVVKVPSRKVLYFRAGRELHKMLNG